MKIIFMMKLENNEEIKAPEGFVLVEEPPLRDKDFIYIPIAPISTIKTVDYYLNKVKKMNEAVLLFKEGLRKLK